MDYCNLTKALLLNANEQFLNRDRDSALATAFLILFLSERNRPESLMLPHIMDFIKENKNHLLNIYISEIVKISKNLEIHEIPPAIHMSHGFIVTRIRNQILDYNYSKNIVFMGMDIKDISEDDCSFTLEKDNIWLKFTTLLNKSSSEFVLIAMGDDKEHIKLTYNIESLYDLNQLIKNREELYLTNQNIIEMFLC